MRALRIDNDIKQQALANVLGIAQNTYSQYETGKIAFTDEMLLKLAKYYHTSVDYLMDLTDEITARGVNMDDYVVDPMNSSYEEGRMCFHMN